ncbi:MAG: hypothetical protein J7647_22020 [Cyanobacteria bacterium SBLK]|nr:hypothetical protein [Cyanobacteria bacterium SBLK]
MSTEIIDLEIEDDGTSLVWLARLKENFGVSDDEICEITGIDIGTLEKWCGLEYSPTQEQLDAVEKRGKEKQLEIRDRIKNAINTISRKTGKERENLDRWIASKIGKHPSEITPLRTHLDKTLNPQSAIAEALEGLVREHG